MTRRFSLAAWLSALLMLALSMTNTPARPETAQRAAPQTPAQTGAPPEVETTNCFDTRNIESCVTIYRGGRLNPHVIVVPQAASDEERAAAEARDRRWVARCRPTIRQDRYGMPRYSYSAQGCEYGKLN